MNKSLNGFIIFILSITSAYGQDSTLTFLQAKDRLIKKNFYLLAAYYEINQAEAQVVQAKLYYNPTIYWNQEAYNKTQDKYLKASNQYETQISQTISIAGRHTNTVKLARINLELNKVQFTDGMRSLLFDLGNNYSSLAAFSSNEILST